MHTTIRTLFAALIVSLLLAACGGGGGDGSAGTTGSTTGGTTGTPVQAGLNSADPTRGVPSGPVPSGTKVLYVSFGYNGSQVALFRASSLTPVITGLEGRTPSCSLAQGRLPTGVVLNADCSITGTPLEFGGFPISVRLGATGTVNTLDWNWGVEVRGPAWGYAVEPTIRVGVPYSVSPQTVAWTPAAGEQVTYLLTGSLPPGVGFDAFTGTVSGLPTLAGTYRFGIAIQVQSAGRTATSETTNLTINVVDQSFYYTCATVYAGVPYSCSPASRPSGNWQYQAGALPPGLVFDPTTASVSGTALSTGGQSVTATATVTANGNTATLSAPLLQGVFSPVMVSYGAGGAGSPGQPLPAWVPTAMNYSGANINGISYTYQLSPASPPLPAGLSLDPSTGAVAGTPTTSGVSSVTVYTTVRLNGATWTESNNLNFSIF